MVTFVAPKTAELRSLADDLGLVLGDADLAAISELSASLEQPYQRVSDLSELMRSVPSERDRGRAPDRTRHSAWAWLARLEGASDGPLFGEYIGIKDSISVAGLPMRVGSATLEGFVPRDDATVVTRVLDAGGTIVGKTTCENLCFSGGSHESKPFPVLNPYDEMRSAGGSSSGNAVAIALGDVNMCIGSDMGGSVRTPASWCGVVGLKPTFGLIPTTGSFPLEPSIDHLGTMGRTVRDAARLLSVIAGPDDQDVRQLTSPPVQDYLAPLNEPSEGLRIGVIREGFGRPESSRATDECVERAISLMMPHGVQAEQVSIPWHNYGYDLSAPILMEGALDYVFRADAMPPGLRNLTANAINERWSEVWRERVNDLPDIAKYVLLFGMFAHRKFDGHYYQRAQILRRQLRSAYDEALKRFDVLALPTTPFTATLLPASTASFGERVTAGLNMEGNTAPFNVSGHPAISIPCGMVDGLPVGLMFVGAHGGEPAIIRAAAAFERLGDWKANRFSNV